MMLGGIRGEEDQLLVPAGDVAPIRDGHAEDARVEVLQARQIETTQPDVAERQLPACDVRYGVIVLSTFPRSFLTPT